MKKKSKLTRLGERVLRTICDMNERVVGYGAVYHFAHIGVTEIAEEMKLNPRQVAGAITRLKQLGYILDRSSSMDDDLIFEGDSSEGRFIILTHEAWRVQPNHRERMREADFTWWDGHEEADEWYPELAY